MKARGRRGRHRVRQEIPLDLAGEPKLFVKVLEAGPGPTARRAQHLARRRIVAHDTDLGGLLDHGRGLRMNMSATGWTRTVDAVGIRRPAAFFSAVQARDLIYE